MHTTTDFTRPDRPQCGTAEDKRLLRRAAAGDRSAFDLLARRHSAALRGFLYRRLHSHEDVEDALAITLAKAWRAREGFRGDSAGKSWLYQIAARVAIDELRARTRRAWECPFEPSAEDRAEEARAETLPGPEAELLVEERRRGLREGLRQALDGLREGDRALLDLCYDAEESYEEISRHMGLTVSQVRGRLHRARERLRRRWEKLAPV
jgi:RNA polymerase sigma-70 factor (ECF subfamily)